MYLSIIAISNMSSLFVDTHEVKKDKRKKVYKTADKKRRQIDKKKQKQTEKSKTYI